MRQVQDHPGGSSTVVIEGELVPVEWNDHDEVTRLAVLVDENDDEIELDSGEVSALLALLGREVVVHGVLLTGTWGNRRLRVSHIEPAEPDA